MKRNIFQAINSQNPSTLDIRNTTDEDDFRASSRSISSNESDEHARGGSEIGKVNGLVGEMEEVWGLDGEGWEKLCRGGRLGDRNICFPVTLPGSWRGNQQEYFMSSIVLRLSRMVLILGLSDGSFWRHFWAISATILAAFMGNRPFSWGSIIRESLHSSARNGQLHLTKFLSSFVWRLSMFFRPVRISRRTIPKL